MSKYSELLLDPRWQKKRLQILERDQWTCRVCGDKTKTLHVHHTLYKRGVDPWDADDKTLVTLCSACHEAEPTAIREYTEDLLLMIKQFGLTSDDVSNICQKIVWGVR